MEFDNNKPIYIQIADSMCEAVLAGKYAAGERIPRPWQGPTKGLPTKVSSSTRGA